ncbi:MAG: ParB/RepB/Spo0J family partition protein [Pleurocapsa sp. SU_196_0]|nr:ParB/RepB/Spo0J family partition protein [Pleurocapsa sp. SU_196_0]
MSKTKRSGLNTANLERYAESLGAQPATPKPLSPLLPVTDLPVSLLDPAPWNARRFFDVKQLQILGVDMLENGQIHPITVRQIGERFEVVVGERRMRAAAMIGMTMLRAHVRSLEDREARRIGLAENLQREDLNPYEETLGWLDLLALELDLAPSFQIFMQGDEHASLRRSTRAARLHKEGLRHKQGTDHNVMS